MVAALLLLAATGHHALAIVGVGALAVCVGALDSTLRGGIPGRSVDPAAARWFGPAPRMGLPPHLDANHTNSFGPL